MHPAPRLALQMALLLVAAALAGVLAQHLSGPSRRLKPMTATPVQLPPQVARQESAPPPPTPQALPHAAPTASKPQVRPQAQLHFEWSPDLPTREIDSRTATGAFQQGLPFLDARRSEDYRQGHIRGAISLPVWEADIDERLTRFDAAGHPLKSPLVIYCSGGDCQDSQLLASRLMGLGYRHLLIYRGGYPDWVAMGLPTRQGEQP